MCFKYTQGNVDIIVSHPPGKARAAGAGAPNGAAAGAVVAGNPPNPPAAGALVAGVAPHKDILFIYGRLAKLKI